jgi:hypothetical protein
MVHVNPEDRKNSVILITGHIDKAARVKDDTAYFSLKSPEGKFFIQTSGQTQIQVCQNLTPNEVILVVGYLRSFVFNRCRSHHSYIQGIRITPLGNIWPELWDEVAAPLILRSEYLQVIRQAK